MSRPLSAESAFRALAHSSRRRLVELVARHEWPACDLAAEFDHAQPTISRHLRILENAGLIQHYRRGTNLMYRITPGALHTVHDWLSRIPASQTSSRQAAPAAKRS